MKRYRWWHAVAFYAAVQGVSFGLRALLGEGSGDRDFYRAERLPSFAPPSAAFPIAWTVNSVCALAGGLHVLNLPRGTAGRFQFLYSQASAWALFASFNAAYFGLRSPINAAAITLMYTGATAASLDAAVRQMKDRKAALSLATTAAWLLLANPVGIAQAAWNRDEFWRVGSLVSHAKG